MVKATFYFERVRGTVEVEFPESGLHSKYREDRPNKCVLTGEVSCLLDDNLRDWVVREIAPSLINDGIIIDEVSFEGVLLKDVLSTPRGCTTINKFLNFRRIEEQGVTPISTPKHTKEELLERKIWRMRHRDKRMKGVDPYPIALGDPESGVII